MQSKKEAKKEDENEFEKQINSVRTPILNYCRSRIFNRSDAEDVSQDTMSILVNKRLEVDPKKNFSGWAFRICGFQIMKYLSRIKRNRLDLVESTSFDSFLFSLSQTESKTPFDSALNKELLLERQKIIKKIINKLPERKKIFFQHSLNGKSKESIIHLMGLKDQYHYHSIKKRTIDTIKKYIKNGELS